MADLGIRKDFVDGVNEIFTTLFNDGKQGDGVKYYPLKPVTLNVFGESKYKSYGKPVLLTCKAEIKPKQGEKEVEGIKEYSTFTVPLKSLQDNDLKYGDEMLKGIMEFQGVFYEIVNISPKAYVEDVFLLYQFSCDELIDFKLGSD